MSSQEVTWGNLSFPGTRISTGAFAQNTGRMGSGAEVERLAQNGAMKYRISDFSSGGMVRYGGIYTVTDGINMLAYNEGLQSRIEKQLTLPYLLTTQSSVTAYDIRTLTASNMRIHAVLSSLGDTGLRWVAGMGIHLFGDTSVSNPALIKRDDFTNSITAMAEIVLNNVTYLAIATNGQTDDIWGATDVSGSAGLGGYVSLATYSNASDAIYAMWRFPQWKRTMFIGQFGGTNGVYSAKDSDAIPLTTMTPVVYTSSKAVPNTNAATLTYGPYYFKTIESGASWTNLTNVLVSDGAFATRSTADAGGFAVYDFDGDKNLPTTLLPTGILIETFAKEDNIAADAYIDDIHLLVDGAQYGIAKTATLSGNEFSTAPTLPISHGGQNDRFGSNLTVDVLRRGDFGISTSINDGDPGIARTISVDYQRITVYAKQTGTPIVLNKGGWTCGGVPWAQDILPYVQPTRDNTSDLTVPTELVFMKVDYDSDGDRLTAEVSKIPTEMKYIWHIKPYLGGVAVCGGNKASERGTILKLVDSTGQVRNLAFPGVHGTTPVFINSLEAQGEWLILDVWNTDGTDRQWWYYRNGKYYADTILQSKSATSVAALGIPFAESSLSLQQNRIYSIFPASTNVGAARQFIPADLLADPLTLNTSEVKSMAFTTGTEDTALRARTPEIDFGPEEAKKSIMVVSYQRRDISSSNTVTVDLPTDGTTTFSSPAVSNTFTTALTDYNVPSAGADYQTIIARLGGKHTASGTGTPNLLPIMLTTSQQWQHLPFYDFEVDTSRMAPADYFALLDRMLALQATKHTQVLRFGNREPQPTVFDVFNAGVVRVPPRGQAATSNDIGKPPVWRFTARRGTVA